MEQEFYRYYSTQRPVDIGTFPKAPDNAPVAIHNFDKRIPIEHEPFSAWGCLDYAKPLTAREADSYELRPAHTNPDIRQAVQAFCTWHTPDKLEPGARLALERNVEFDGWRVDQSNLVDLTALPLAALQAKREQSAAAEKAILEKMQTAAQEWEVQAVQTMLLDRAMEYLQTPAVSHTGNEWAAQKDGIWEISNLVYKMRYRVSEETGGKRAGQWLAAWGIALNRPERPPGEKFYYAGDVMVVEQKKKYYNAEAGARHYIQGRFDQYAHLFSQLSPPVPAKYQRHFHIHGVLLPGYTIAPQEPTPQERTEELLSLLEADDLLPLALEPPKPKKPPAKKKSQLVR